MAKKVERVWIHIAGLNKFSENSELWPEVLMRDAPPHNNHVHEWQEFRRFPNPKPKVTKEQIKQIVALRKKGMTCREVEAIVGVSFATVSRHSYGVTPRKRKGKKK